MRLGLTYTPRSHHSEQISHAFSDHQDFICFSSYGDDLFQKYFKGAQWLSGRVLDSRPRGRGIEPHWRHCFVALGQDIFFLASGLSERLLIGRKESN